jgi:hypothetical protein
MHEFYAYGTSHAGIETVMRFHAVKRWHMIDTTRIQTIAEHSANVALLAFYIARTCPGMWFGPAEHYAALGLVHDAAETFTGDFPSHSKKHLQGVVALEKKTLPSEFIVESTERGNLLVKLCDLADGIRFIRLHGVDITAKHAQGGVEIQFNERLQDMFASDWPPEVRRHVLEMVKFYAYEFK